MNYENLNVGPIHLDRIIQPATIDHRCLRDLLDILRLICVDDLVFFVEFGFQILESRSWDDSKIGH